MPPASVPFAPNPLRYHQGELTPAQRAVLGRSAGTAQARSREPVR